MVHVVLSASQLKKPTDAHGVVRQCQPRDEFVGQVRVTRKPIQVAESLANVLETRNVIEIETPPAFGGTSISIKINNGEVSHPVQQATRYFGAALVQ